MLRNFRRNIIIGLALGAGLYFILGMYADFSGLGQALKNFSWKFLPLALALVCVNWGVRFLKWEYLLRVIGVNIPVIPSLVVFMSGFTMIISPARMGEVMKSIMIKEYAGVPISRTSPVIVAERATDVIGVLVLGSIGSLAYDFGKGVLAVAAIFIIAFIGLVQTRSLCQKLLHLAERLPFLKRFIAHREEFYESAYSLLQIKHLLPTVALSVVGWFFECLAAWLCLRGLGVELSLLLVMFIFVVASLAGAIAMIPGGLGVAEGSMAGMLMASNVGRSPAVAGTILIRLTTFWFAILLGLAGISLYGTLVSGKKKQGAESS